VFMNILTRIPILYAVRRLKAHKPNFTTWPMKLVGSDPADASATNLRSLTTVAFPVSGVIVVQLGYQAVENIDPGDRYTPKYGPS
jgi:hypothetical protein